MLNRTHIARAHKIAAELEAEGLDVVTAGTIIGMALGIFMEGQPHSHRNLVPLATALNDVAQKAFDALREGRERDPGHG
jgi:hypothetical protein